MTWPGRSDARQAVVGGRSPTGAGRPAQPRPDRRHADGIGTPAPPR